MCLPFIHFCRRSCAGSHIHGLFFCIYCFDIVMVKQYVFFKFQISERTQIYFKFKFLPHIPVYAEHRHISFVIQYSGCVNEGNSFIICAVIHGEFTIARSAFPRPYFETWKKGQ